MLNGFAEEGFVTHIKSGFVYTSQVAREISSVRNPVSDVDMHRRKFVSCQTCPFLGARRCSFRLCSFARRN